MSEATFISDEEARSGPIVVRRGWSVTAAEFFARAVGRVEGERRAQLFYQHLKEVSNRNRTEKGRAKKIENAASGVTKRQEAVATIVADFERRDVERVTARMVANKLATITDKKTGKLVYPHASRRTISDDIKLARLNTGRQKPYR